MRAILTVFAKEFRENLRERRTLFSALLLGPVLVPLLFYLLLGLQIRHNTGSQDKPVALAVAHAERAPHLMQALAAAGITVQPVAYEAGAAREAVRTHKEARVLAVSEEFARHLQSGSPAPLVLYADASDVAAAPDTERVRGALAQYGALIARLRLVARGSDPLLLGTIAVQDVDVSTPATRSVVALSTLSYMILLTMLMGGIYLAIDATAGERERGSLEPLLTLPVPRAHLVYGKILAACAYMALSLTLTVVAFAIVLRFTGLERFGMSINFGPAVALGVILACLPLVPLGAALMTLVAAFTRSYREAQTYVGLMLLVPTLPLVFASVSGLRPTLPLMAVPSLSQHFLITGLLRDEALPAPFAAVSVAVTLLAGALLVWLAGRLYRRESLLG
ncbi:MAG TPA: ABC transporter permease [Steroidobacteraceae bacterium]|nr:ABC transporter permease [Steroidobacteraceae bacterium]